jgi:hypothetical protein
MRLYTNQHRFYCGVDLPTRRNVFGPAAGDRRQRPLKGIRPACRAPTPGSGLIDLQSGTSRVSPLPPHLLTMEAIKGLCCLLIVAHSAGTLGPGPGLRLLRRPRPPHRGTSFARAPRGCLTLARRSPTSSTADKSPTGSNARAWSGGWRARRRTPPGTTATSRRTQSGSPPGTTASDDEGPVASGRGPRLAWPLPCHHSPMSGRPSAVPNDCVHLPGRLQGT